MADYVTVEMCDLWIKRQPLAFTRRLNILSHFVNVKDECMKLCCQSVHEQASPLVGMRRIQSAHASRLSRGAGSTSSLAEARRARSAVVQSRDESRINSTNQRYARLVITVT